jgi:hypothetical protein
VVVRNACRALGPARCWAAWAAGRELQATIGHTGRLLQQTDQRLAVKLTRSDGPSFWLGQLLGWARARLQV